MSTILVQLSERTWTLRALHQACALARRTRSTLVLLHLMPVTNPYLLGTPLAVTPPSRAELKEIREFELMAEDYGVEVTRQQMQYESLAGALLQAAEQTQAMALFADLPRYGLPVWHQLQHWYLQRGLNSLNCRLLTLGKPDQVDELNLSVNLGIR
ncbi:MAG: universal stress protein [Anaerolineae bacterium]|nr:universal stress protein [Anaerolineae bacterium]